MYKIWTYINVAVIHYSTIELTCQKYIIIYFIYGFDKKKTFVKLTIIHYPIHIYKMLYIPVF